MVKMKMKRRLPYLKSFLVVLTLATLFGLVTAYAQLSQPQSSVQANPQNRDNDITRAEWQASIASWTAIPKFLSNCTRIRHS